MFFGAFDVCIEHTKAPRLSHKLFGNVGFFPHRSPPATRMSAVVQEADAQAAALTDALRRLDFEGQFQMLDDVVEAR